MWRADIDTIVNDTPEDAAVAAPQPVSVGSLIDQYFALREQKKELDRESDTVKAAMEVIAEELLKVYDAQGVTLCRGRLASASLSETVIPIVDDWDSFTQYIIENEALHLLERRPSTAAWRELHEGGELVPGTAPFTKRTINVRKL
jgi:hypothetical protein